MGHVPYNSAEGATLQNVAEAIPHPAWLSDPTGSTEYINSLGAEYLGGPTEENYGWGWVRVLHPEDVDRVRAQWEQATQNVTPFDLTFRIRGGDGEYRWHEGKALPMRSPEGDVVKWIGTFDAVDLPAPGPNGERGPAPSELSERELSVLRFVANGYTNAEIAKLIGVSLRTIEATRANLRKNWGLHTRADLVRFARASGIDANRLS